MRRTLLIGLLLCIVGLQALGSMHAVAHPEGMPATIDGALVEGASEAAADAHDGAAGTPFGHEDGDPLCLLFAALSGACAAVAAASIPPSTPRGGVLAALAPEDRTSRDALLAFRARAPPIVPL